MTETIYPPVRRVVTGHGDDNAPKVLIDGASPHTRHSKKGLGLTLIWGTDEMPADIGIGESIDDMGTRPPGTPPAGGTRIAVLDLLPGCPSLMHRTETIDYAIVLEGELEMDMPGSTVKLKAGDIIVQRGTEHAWANRGTERARIAFVLIDAKPLGIGKAIAQNADIR